MNKQPKEFDKLFEMLENEMAEKAAFAMIKGLVWGMAITLVVVAIAYTGLR